MTCKEVEGSNSRNFRKGGDSLFRVIIIDLSGVLFKLWHYGWRKDLVRKRKAKEGFSQGGRR